ncbi:MAG: hypothetical protein ICV59_04340 [Thermoleophilia bacterium]|nr:hypothetical protein [Thermoleophilia bacterium]
MACRCTYVEELYGDEAEAYARGHLRSDELDEDALHERLSCPDTGRRWVLEYPERTGQDAGQARLRLEPT